ncbi:NAD-independent protein deacetylase AcuC [Halalkalibacter wakoensis JCM 9140]|uniref:Acetoin utilization protein AcuC n=1 Tax=Halalkalibacter wakoensis JCM 9140 TaxID=1236970 RepID=W4Q163_9BACI|nr:acetoin utilization protein AcuC [Halalkalibacter wakoensis]GAE25821.1 NAD-independent protein deacetylase AcuC [Halalkalibacter wakoensis JCM 9140]
MKKDAVFIFSDEQLAYRFNDKHPFNHMRLQLTYDLLTSLNMLDTKSIIAPRIATDEEIALIHDEAFIDAVKTAGHGLLDPAIAANYGLGTEDTPIFANMHEAASLLVGGTLQAVDEVMTGRAQHALHLGGGLHHGFKGKASGFCIYNDSSIAIEYMKKKYGARVLYVDTDAHHGDGVQWAFYDDPDVCTLSIHETGRYLFPGTGQVHEKGTGKGYGFSINVPVDAFTEDESFLEVYETSFREVIEFFKPDVILTQNGADAHHFDPLTHLCSTIETYKRIPKLAHELAHEFCDGRWIAVGGGGYDIWRVVPRAWAYIWLTMTNQTNLLSDAIPEAWLNKWSNKAEEKLPNNWFDSNIVPTIPRKPEITEKNAKTLEKALFHIRNEKRK